MKRIVLCFFIIIVLTSLVSAISYEDFDLAKNFSNSNNYSITIEMLEGKCHNLSGDDYKEAQCHFVLGYCYYKEFMNRQMKDKAGSSGFGLKRDLILINQSITHYNQAINLSWSNLTDKDLRVNNKFHFLTSSLFINADNYIMLKDYENAERILISLNTILSLAPNSEQFGRLKLMYDKLYSAIPKKVEVELKGDLNPLFYSQPEIKPEIILESEKNPDFDILYVEYYNLNGLNEEEIHLTNSQFIFDKKLSLYKNNSLFFPFKFSFSLRVSP